MQKLTILVDMDDVIEDLLGAWVSALNEQHGLSVDKDSISDWDVTKFFPTLTKLQVFAPLYSKDFWRTVKPIDGAADVLQRLIDDGHTLYIVTSSFHENLSAKMTDVLFKYFPFFKWEDVIITSHKQLVKGDVLVDDGVHNLEDGEYLKVLMDAPHNRFYDAESAGMHRAMDWEQVYNIITQYAILSNLNGEESNNQMNVILYSTGCPRCKVLKQKLDSKAIPYTENNSVDEMLGLGISQVPVLSVDGKLFPFVQANEWLNNHQYVPLRALHQNKIKGELTMLATAKNTIETTYEYDDLNRVIKKTVVETGGAIAPTVTTTCCDNDDEIETGIELEGAVELSQLEVFLTAAAGAVAGSLLYHAIHRN